MIFCCAKCIESDKKEAEFDAHDFEMNEYLQVNCFLSVGVEKRPIIH